MKRQMIPLMILVAALAGCGEKAGTAGGVSGKAQAESVKQNLVGFCVIKSGPCGYFDTVAKQFAIPPQFDKTYGFDKRGLAEVVKDGKAGFINAEGHIAVPLQFSWVQRFNSKGVSAACQEPDKCGYIDTAGHWVIPPQFESIYSSDSDLIETKQDGKWGYVNIKGQWVIPAQFEYAERFSANGLAQVKQDDKYGYVDTSGQMVIPPQFKYAYSFGANGLAGVTNQEGKYGFIDAKGHWAVPAQFESGYRFEKNGLAAVKQGGKYGWVDASGQMVIPAQFEFSISFSDNGLAATKKEENSKFGYVNAKGQWVIPEQFSYAGDFSSAGLAYIKINGKCGYVDGKGQLLVPPQFDKCDEYDVFEKGVSEVQQGGRSGYIDSTGKWVVYRDTVCDTPVVKNADDQVVWPKKPVADICAEAEYAKKKEAAEAEVRRNTFRYSYGDKVSYYGYSNNSGWEGVVMERGDGRYLVKLTRITVNGFLAMQLNASSCSGNENIEYNDRGKLIWVPKDCLE